VDILLKYGGKAGKLPNGESCLHAAAISGRVAVVKRLLAEVSKKAKGNARVDPVALNAEGKTALDLAKERGYEDIIEVLRKYEEKEPSQPKDPAPEPISQPSPPHHVVRFTLPKPDDDEKGVRPRRVRCRMVTNDELRRERSSPVRLVWNNGQAGSLAGLSGHARRPNVEHLTSPERGASVLCFTSGRSR